MRALMASLPKRIGPPTEQLFRAWQKEGAERGFGPKQAEAILCVTPSRNLNAVSRPKDVPIVSKMKNLAKSALTFHSTKRARAFFF